MKKLINVNEYRLGSFSFQNYATDFYYTRLAKQFYDILWFSGYGKECGEMICYDIALALAHYMEDVVADFGLWRIFVEKHRGLYGRSLPFYDDIDDADYYPDEPHLQDVQFIIWMYVQLLHENNSIVNPENPYLTEVAGTIYRLIDREFEQAPINSEISSVWEQVHDATDMFQIKDIMQRMCGSYLLLPFQEDMYTSTSEYLNVYQEQMDSGEFDYAVKSINLFTKKHGPLNLYMKEWLAALLLHHGYEELSKWVTAVESRELCVYRICGYDERHLQLETTKGELFSLDRTSFASLPDETLQANSYLTASIVRYRGEWNVNGINSLSSSDDVFNKMKEIDGCHEADAKTARMMLEATHGYPLAYFADTQSMIQWISKTLKISEQHTDTGVLDHAASNIALYISDEGISVLPNAALCIKDKRNPYYDSSRVGVGELGFILSGTESPASLAHMLLENHMLPDLRINSTYGVERGRQLIQDNFDFWLRFMRSDNY